MKKAKLRLTQKEREAEEHDQKVVDAARTMNAAHGTDIFSAKNVIPSVLPVAQLTYWAMVGNAGKVKTALKTGGDVNASDPDGYTALHAAVENGHAAIVRLLLQAGANKNAQIQTGDEAGATPRDLATMPEIIALLDGENP